MSEPTKEQIEEAIPIRLKFCAPNGTISSFELAKIIAFIRTQANNDALELAALKCHENMMLYRGSDEFDDAQQGRADGSEGCRDDIRAMKVTT